MICAELLCGINDVESETPIAIPGLVWRIQKQERRRKIRDIASNDNGPPIVVMPNRRLHSKFRVTDLHWNRLCAEDFRIQVKSSRMITLSALTNVLAPPFQKTDQQSKICEILREIYRAGSGRYQPIVFKVG